MGEQIGKGELNRLSYSQTGQKIGTIFLRNHTKTDGTQTGKYEIGWQLLPAAWGQGFMTEAARTMIAVARAESIDRIYAVVSEENTRSLSLCERLGMKKIGLTNDWYEATLVECILDLQKILP